MNLDATYRENILSDRLVSILVARDGASIGPISAGDFDPSGIERLIEYPLLPKS